MYSLEDIRKYAKQNSPKGLLIDTCILILFLVGKYAPDCIEECDLLSDYSLEDFQLLEKIFLLFPNKKLFITPQIIAELSNLTVTGRKGLTGKKLIPYLSKVIDFFKSAEECHQTIDCLYDMQITIISEFGFTDMTMFQISKNKNIPIVTEDYRFATYAINNQIPAICLKWVKASQYQSALQ